jgi:hypothetical protein
MLTGRAILWLLAASIPGPVCAEGAADSWEVSHAAKADSSSVSADFLESSAVDSTSLPDSDDAWTADIWNEIDYMVQMESFKLKKTVVTSGVRGDEAAEDQLEDLQFTDAPPRPTKKNIGDAISTLKGSLERDEALLEGASTDSTTGTKLDGTAKKRLFIARAHEQLGEIDSARAYYMSLLSEQYADVSHAAEAKSHLAGFEDGEGAADSSRAEGH